jgi:hypothetical protein
VKCSHCLYLITQESASIYPFICISFKCKRNFFCVGEMHPNCAGRRSNFVLWHKSRDSSVGIATGYGLGARDFPVLHSVQTG